MFRWIVKLIDRLFVIAGAIIFAQFPQFYAQYTQLLSGHTAELNYLVSQMQEAAALSHNTLASWISKFTQNADPDIIKQGGIMQMIVDRLDSFTRAQDAFASASLFTKPFLFIRYADLEIFRSTLAQFKWGFNFTIETLAYVLIGMLLGLLVFQVLRSFFLFIGAKLSWRRKAPPL